MSLIEGTMEVELMVTKRNSEWTVYLTLDSELAVVTGDGAGVGITYSRS